MAPGPNHSTFEAVEVQIQSRKMEYLNATLAWETAVPLAEQMWVTLINEPAHLIVEGVLVVFVLMLLFQRSYRIPKSIGPAPLTDSVRNHPLYHAF